MKKKKYLYLIAPFFATMSFMSIGINTQNKLLLVFACITIVGSIAFLTTYKEK
jgi:hypothetical protein